MGVSLPRAEANTNFIRDSKSGTLEFKAVDAAGGG